MYGYVKFLKDLVTNMRSINYENVDGLHHFSEITSRSLMQKKGDPEAFTILCTIGIFRFSRALCDMGTRINLMSLKMFK